MEDIFEKLYEMTAFSNIIAEPSFLIMYAIAFVLLYLGIKKHYEPLLLVPIAFGVLLANFPGGDMGVVQADQDGMIMVNGVMKNIWEMSLPEIAHDLGLMNFLYYMLIKTGFLPPVIFMGVGALTDFGPMLRNLRLSIFGAAAQLGIFAVLLAAIAMGFTPQEAGSLGIIGGADGPTAIFTTIKLAPHLLGPIAIAAYSYMALVPVIIPLVVKLLCTKKELMINMKEQEKLYPSKTEIKNLRVLKILFPIVVTTVVALFVPTAVPLIGMLMFGNLIKEIGSDTSRLFDEPVRLWLKWENLQPVDKLCLRIEILSLSEVPLGTYVLCDFYSGEPGEIGERTVTLDVSMLTEGEYRTFYTFFYRDDRGNHVNVENVPGLCIRITRGRKDLTWDTRYWGHIRLPEPRIDL